MSSMYLGLLDTAIMKQRIHKKLILSVNMVFHDMKLKRSSAPSVEQNKMSSSIALVVEFAWERCCYSKLMEDGHRRVEKAMHQNCPVCFQFLFDSTEMISILPCGLECLKEMELHHRYSCPVCSKSVCDMSKLCVVDSFKHNQVWILCNDCGVKCAVQFHIVAHKCLKLDKTQRAPTASCSTNVVEMVR
ncbi:hypothetical protein L484_020638 [Morus notabilis]|uniref:RCHY1 zinc-ribbon domain-containing protein n=1 Tax=Morus notabilis TaxID=981085 RepID=W9S947_9ROSA|nr:hypothetical protein L484_020638 [Morus notabilis]